MVNPQMSWDMFQSNENALDEGMENHDQQPQSLEQETLSPPDSQKDQNKSWDQFPTQDTYVNPEEEDSESSLGWLVRNAVSARARLHEESSGRYGNIQKATKGLLKSKPEFGGILTWGLQKMMGKEKFDSFLDIIPDLPTSEDFRKGTEYLTGDYTKPKTEGESKFQEYTKDVGSTISPFAGIPTPRHALINHFVVPAVANMAKEAVKGLGFKEDKAEYAKIATWITASLMGNVDARAFGINLANQGRQALPNFLTANIGRYQNRLAGVNRNLLHNDPRTTLARSQLLGIENDIAQGQTSIQDLMTRYDALNAARRSHDLFAFNPGDREYAINAINRVQDAVRQEILHTGANYPQALQNWQEGMTALRIVHQSNTMTNWIRGQLSQPHGKAAGGALSVGSAAALFGIKPSIGLSAKAAIPAAGLYKTGQVAYRVYNDRNLRRYYFDAISAAQTQNANQFIKSYNKLNEELDKPDKKRKKSTL